jgi:hypothetical protein
MAMQIFWDVRMMMTKNYYSKDERRGRYGMPDVRMMTSKNYYGKVEHRR